MAASLAECGQLSAKLRRGLIKKVGHSMAQNMFGDNEENARLMLAVIRDNLVRNPKGAKLAYIACSTDEQTLIKAQLTVGERKALGLAEMGTVDHVEFALRTLMRQREQNAFGKRYSAVKKLGGNIRALATYQMLTA
jgi:hypothetical protein